MKTLLVAILVSIPQPIGGIYEWMFCTVMGYVLPGFPCHAP